jgi:hypothetical protein
MGADEGDIKIDAKYPLGRFIVRLADKEDNPMKILIEIGYTKRNPLLGDAQYPLSQTSVEVTTPIPEELYAGKLAALFSRATSRDMFDVWLISQSNIDVESFRKSFIVESLVSLDIPFFQMDIDDLLSSIAFDSGLQNLLPIGQYDKDTFNRIRQEVHNFINNLISELSKDEEDGIMKFYNTLSLTETFWTRQEFFISESMSTLHLLGLLRSSVSNGNNIVCHIFIGVSQLRIQETCRISTMQGYL